MPVSLHSKIACLRAALTPHTTDAMQAVLVLAGGPADPLLHTLRSPHSPHRPLPSLHGEGTDGTGVRLGIAIKLP